MTPYISLLFDVTEGKLVVDHGRLAGLVSTLRDGRYELTIERWIEKRSNQQNRFYHGVVVKLLGEYWGLDHDDAHDLIKLHCNPKIVEVVNQATGEVHEETIGGSTAKLNKEEWNEFLERCQRWAAEQFNVVIPDPDPEWRFNQKQSAA